MSVKMTAQVDITFDGAFDNCHIGCDSCDFISNTHTKYKDGKATGMELKIEEAVRRMKKIRRFAPFFLDKELDEVIATLESITTCGHCKYLTVQDDGVNYCKLYKTAKPWDGFCEKGEKR